MDHSHDLPQCWPTLPLAEWEDTRATLHMWTQIVGKVRLRLTPLVNHWWNVPLYVSARGLTTSRIPYEDRAFELYFDFLEHRLVLETSDGQLKSIPLVPRSVADFYADFMTMLKSGGIDVKIWTMPVEIPNPIPFEQDHMHAAYDHKYIERFWRRNAERASSASRARYISSGEVSIWRSPDFRVGALRSAQAPIPSPAKPTRTK